MSEPREDNPHPAPLIHTQGQFKTTRVRHELIKKKYAGVPKGRGIPLTCLPSRAGLSS
jgi:hypothetical protein